MVNNQLNIEGATAYAQEKAAADDSLDITVSSLAVNKLIRYISPLIITHKALRKFLSDFILISFLYYFSQKLRLGISYESSSRHPGTSNMYPQHMFWWRNKKRYLSGYPLLSGTMLIQ